MLLGIVWKGAMNHKPHKKTGKQQPVKGLIFVLIVKVTAETRLIGSYVLTEDNLGAAARQRETAG